MMKAYISLLATIFICVQLLAKNPLNDVKPQFPGGENALMEFLNKNLVYPEEAQKQKWEGKTLVGFVVNEDGTIENPHIIKSSWSLLDSEALRIVQLMPKWKPATINGKPKKEMVVLPIMFNLKRKNFQE